MSAGPVALNPEDWVGRGHRIEVRLHRETVEALEASLDRPTPASEAPLAPLRHWLWLFAPPVTPNAGLGTDGHPARGALVPDWPLPRRMWAGSEIHFHAPLMPDAKVWRETRVESVQLKTGRSGQLGFVQLRHRWLQDQICALDDLQTVVYREASPKQDPSAVEAPRPAPPPASGPHADWSVTHRPDAVQLFRYSALTANAHRIHYDADYARSVEGYPGCVVHGPLLATLMLDAFRDAHPKAQVRRFRFRALAAAFEGAMVHCTGALRAAGQAQLSVQGQDGTVHLEGEADFE